MMNSNVGLMSSLKQPGIETLLQVTVPLTSIAHSYTWSSLAHYPLSIALKSFHRAQLQRCPHHQLRWISSKPHAKPFVAPPTPSLRSRKISTRPTSCDSFPPPVSLSSFPQSSSTFSISKHPTSPRADSLFAASASVCKSWGNYAISTPPQITLPPSSKLRSERQAFTLLLSRLACTIANHKP